MTIFDVMRLFPNGQRESFFEPEAGDDFLPTDAVPGSAEKMAIFTARLERGQPLFHPQDRTNLERVSRAAPPLFCKGLVTRRRGGHGGEENTEDRVIEGQGDRRTG